MFEKLLKFIKKIKQQDMHRKMLNLLVMFKNLTRIQCTRDFFSLILGKIYRQCHSMDYSYQ